MAEMTAPIPAHTSFSKEEILKNNNQKLAMWLYIASEIVIFSIMIVGYIIYRINEPDVIKQAHDSLSILLVTANTFILLMSSWSMVMGLREMQKGNRRGMLQWIGLTALLGVVFMGGQYVEYLELAHLEVTLGLAPGGVNETPFAGFGMRFYAPTFFHGAHVFVGVLWALLVMWRGSKGRYDHNPIGIELFGLYWHFVDVVWVMLFTFIYLV